MLLIKFFSCIYRNRVKCHVFCDVLFLVYSYLYPQKQLYHFVLNSLNLKPPNYFNKAVQGIKAKSRH